MPPAASDQPTLSLDPTMRRLTAIWPNGREVTVSYVWLRHASKCPGGMPNDTVNKMELVPDDPAGLAIRNAAVADGSVRIAWSDNDVVTEHPLDDLAGEDVSTPPPCLWRAADTDRLPRFGYDDLADDDRLLALFRAVRDWGIALIRDVPTEDGTVGRLAERFGPITVSGYGKLFDVKSDRNKALGSNTAVYLGPHTDESYRYEPPGISFFHCMASAADAGGDSILVDGFAAARRLQENDNQAFRTLTETPIRFHRFAAGSEDMFATAPIIGLDPQGHVETIRFTDRNIPPQSVPLDRIEGFYRAYKAYWREVNDPAARLQYVMQPGDLHVFDNYRVLHGRQAFDPDKGLRHLQQCAVDRAEFHSTLRVLELRLRD